MSEYTTDVASPKCCERGCVIRFHWEAERPVGVYQHGDNPEAVFVIDRFSMRHDPAGDVRRRFREWAEGVHRYEGGQDR